MRMQTRVRRGARTTLMTFSLVYILLLIAAATAAPWAAPYDPTAQNYALRLAPPGTPGHPLGTDDLGRDVFSRIIFGSRSALFVGVLSVSIALGLGLVIGITAGWFGGWADNALMLLMDGMLSFPAVLLAITVVAMFGYGIGQVTAAIGLVFSPVLARVIRAETMVLKGEGYVESARALGTPVPVIVLRHILPNMAGKIIVQCSLFFALAVVVEAGLSYLGLGSQPPRPSWGLMLKDARNYVFRAAWLAVYPGLAVAMTVLSFNILGDTLSDRLNPLSD